MIVYEIMDGGSLEDIFRSQTKKKGFWKPSRSQVKPQNPASLQPPPALVLFSSCSAALKTLFPDPKPHPPKPCFENPEIPKPYSQTWSWSMDLFRALCFLHQSNPPLLHRDIKPANLLLSGDWRTMKVRAKPYLFWMWMP